MKILRITARQRQIIIGKMLGDGHLETQTNGKTFRLKIEHSAKQAEYVNWQFEELKTLATGIPKLRTIKLDQKLHNKIWFNTVSSPSLRFYAQQFYHNGRKQVPRLIAHWLTPLALAVWYMDDGSIKSTKHRAKIINTQSFNILEIKYLQDALLKKYGIQTKLRRQKEGWQIYLLAETIEQFEKIVRPYIVPTMRYKLG